jgi:translation initiation factor 2 beta subunit (eIF-2beta)/eIF-5
VITNFEDLCRYVNRHPDHVMDYFNNELGRKGSMGNYGYSKIVLIQ